MASCAVVTALHSCRGSLSSYAVSLLRPSYHSLLSLLGDSTLFLNVSISFFLRTLSEILFLFCVIFFKYKFRIYMISVDRSSGVQPEGLTHVYRAICAILQPRQVIKEYSRASVAERVFCDG
jgi:hypothetical protein